MLSYEVSIFNLISKYYFHKSITPNLDGDDISAGFRTNYNSRNINFKVGALYIGDNFKK